MVPPRRKLKPSGAGREVDEDAVVRRYVSVTTMSVAECARSFGIGRGRVTAILEARGIAMRSRKRPDEDEVITAYGMLGSVASAAAVCGIDQGKVREILGSRGIERSRRQEPALDGRQLAVPRPADKITVAEAARILGMDRRAAGRAVRDGVIPSRLDEEGRRYLIRGDVQSFGASISAAADPRPG